MVKISDHDRSIVHDYFTLYAHLEDGTLQFICTGDYSHVQLAIEELGCDYVLDRVTYSQLVPKKERRFKLDGN